MKGRSPWNKPNQRKADVYNLIIQIGGEARWKTLKAHLQELHLGPTTLKQTLDEMVKEKSIAKEARLGSDGAEVWYKIQPDLKEIERISKEKSLEVQKTEKFYEEIKKKASKLQGEEKDNYLLNQLLTIIEAASKSYIQLIGSFVWSCGFNDRAIVTRSHDYHFTHYLLNNTRSFENMLSDDPITGLKAIRTFQIKDKAKLERAIKRDQEFRETMLDMAKRSTPKKQKEEQVD